MPSSVAEAVYPAILAGLGASLVISVVLVLTKAWHGRITLDGDTGVQKFHSAPTPRVGGLALFAGLAAACWTLDGETRSLALMLLVSGIPAFAAGLAEDLTKAVSPLKRLLATIGSGLVLGAVYGVAFDLVDTQWLYDAGWATNVAGLLLVAVGVGGVANAVNITDGFHGLAPGSLVIMLVALALIAAGAGDLTMVSLAMVVAGVMLGFLVVNFPMGRLFLGDAGAYFGGFLLAAIAILITSRNEVVSPFVMLLALFYPIYETLFSIARKRRREGHSPTQPDGVHLHMLVSRSFARPIAKFLGAPSERNALAGLLMWPFPALCAVMAVCFDESGRAAAAGCIAFALFYGRIYQIVSLNRRPLLNVLDEAWRERQAVREGGR